jgi:hypothetical protein
MKPAEVDPKDAIEAAKPDATIVVETPRKKTPFEERISEPIPFIVTKKK